MGLSPKKSIAHLQAEASGEANGLKRVLGATNLTMLGIGLPL